VKASGPARKPTWPRRQPRQKRGERRVADLVRAAACEFAQAGYEATTMSAIARRARASIGSLYQFFPNKESLARALRTQYAREYEQLCEPLEAQVRSMSIEKLAGSLVSLMVEFGRRHPAFLNLVEAPSATRIPEARERHRQWVARLLRAHSPQLSTAKSLATATVVTQINRAMLTLYAQSAPQQRQWVVEESDAVLSAYLKLRLRER
jgi:AcrR family transcriptional regulator